VEGPYPSSSVGGLCEVFDVMEYCCSSSVRGSEDEMVQLTSVPPLVGSSFSPASAISSRRSRMSLQDRRSTSPYVRYRKPRDSVRQRVEIFRRLFGLSGGGAMVMYTGVLVVLFWLIERTMVP
jgi:hypothetical protein